MIRVGILGNANIARRSLIPAFTAHPSFEVAGVASRSGDISYSDMIARSDVDLIYCPLPTGLHHEWVKKALESGKHVLCEKSLACTYGEVQDLVDVARRNGRFLMESFQFRFHAQNLYVKKLLAERAVGEVRQMTVRFGIPPFPEGAKNIRYSKELGGGALLDNGAYTIKCATYFLGKENIRMLAAVEGGETPSLGNVDLTGAMMLMVGDVPVQTAYGFDHFYQNGYEIWGTEGRISTVRAFTAREDFAAPVILETKSGRDVKTFSDDHFARLMDYLAKTIPSGEYESEYEECLVQAKTLGEAHDCAIRS